MTRTDFVELYDQLSNQTGIPEEALEFISVIADELFIPERIKNRLEKRHKNLKDQLSKYPDDNKKIMLKIAFLEDLIKILFFGIEEAPLQINGIFQTIAKIRLEKALL
jgi:hypothetical protein